MVIGAKKHKNEHLKLPEGTERAITYAYAQIVGVHGGRDDGVVLFSTGSYTLSF